jgi:hypothetical protein
MYSPEYKDWPVAHRRLLMAMLIVPVCLLLFAWMVILPKWRQCRRLEQEFKSQEKALRTSVWPMEAEVLRERLSSCNQTLNGAAGQGGLLVQTEEVLEQATRNLREKVCQSTPALTPQESLNGFVQQASRIDYKYLASQLDQALRQSQVRLPRRLLTMDEGSSINIPRQVLHIWTLQMAVELAQRNGLQIMPRQKKDDASPDGKPADKASRDSTAEIAPVPADADAETLPKAALAMLPVTSYILKDGDDYPYLLEFPVKMTVQGTTEQLLAFLQSLQSKEYFLPVKQMTFLTKPPEDLAGDKGIVDKQTMNLVCTAFFRPPAKLPQAVPNHQQPTSIP